MSFDPSSSECPSSEWPSSEHLNFEHLIFENPLPQMQQDWDNGHYQWREITVRTYLALAARRSLHSDPRGFMQAEPVEILRNGEGLHVCCQQANGHYFARLIPTYDWPELKYYPLPKVKALKASLL